MVRVKKREVKIYSAEPRMIGTIVKMHLLIKYIPLS